MWWFQRIVMATAVVTVAGAGTASVCAAQDGVPVTQEPRGRIGAVLQFGARDNGTMEYPVIVSVEPGSPAQRAGLVAGDTVVAYDSLDARTNGTTALVPNQKVVVHYRRNGERSTVVTVVPRNEITMRLPDFTIVSGGLSSLGGTLKSLAQYMCEGGTMPTPMAAPWTADGGVPIVGVSVAPMTPGLAAALQVRNTGVLILNVTPNMPAGRAGIQSGDVVVSVSGVAITGVLQISREVAAKTSRGERSAVFDVVRQGKVKKMTVKW